ncbi:MAG: MarR family winged helix-turn-helix transcriptional regulator [Paracoccaceae bacterium]|nr:MarR family winged helix-turn-helix transcriptional regulator [Paracoccaceae bacterium]
MKTQELYQLVWMSRPLMQAAEACVESGLAGTDLTVRMRAVLEILRAGGDLAVPEIAAKLEINRQYVQLMVNETLASGFTELRPNPRHKRSPLLTLTDKGRELIDNVITREMEIIRTIGSELSDEEVSTALNVVSLVTSRLRAQDGST